MRARPGVLLALFVALVAALPKDGDSDDLLTATLEQLHQEQQFHKWAADQLFEFKSRLGDADELADTIAAQSDPEFSCDVATKLEAKLCRANIAVDSTKLAQMEKDLSTARQAVGMKQERIATLEKELAGARDAQDDVETKDEKIKQLEEDIERMKKLQAETAKVDEDEEEENEEDPDSAAAKAKQALAQQVQEVNDELSAAKQQLSQSEVKRKRAESDLSASQQRVAQLEAEADEAATADTEVATPTSSPAADSSCVAKWRWKAGENPMIPVDIDATGMRVWEDWSDPFQEGSYKVNGIPVPIKIGSNPGFCNYELKMDNCLGGDSCFPSFNVRVRFTGCKEHTTVTVRGMETFTAEEVCADEDDLPSALKLQMKALGATSPRQVCKKALFEISKWFDEFSGKITTGARQDSLNRKECV
jgi:hypothetical protein